MVSSTLWSPSNRLGWPSIGWNLRFHRRPVGVDERKRERLHRHSPLFGHFTHWRDARHPHAICRVSGSGEIAPSLHPGSPGSHAPFPARDTARSSPSKLLIGGKLGTLATIGRCECDRPSLSFSLRDDSPHPQVDKRVDCLVGFLYTVEFHRH